MTTPRMPRRFPPQDHPGESMTYLIGAGDATIIFIHFNTVGSIKSGRSGFRTSSASPRSINRVFVLNIPNQLVTSFDDQRVAKLKCFRFNCFVIFIYLFKFDFDRFTASC